MDSNRRWSLEPWYVGSGYYGSGAHGAGTHKSLAIAMDKLVHISFQIKCA